MKIFHRKCHWIPVEMRVCEIDGDTYTVILLHCHCGSIDRISIHGDWTNSEILNRIINGKANFDAEFLNTLRIARD